MTITGAMVLFAVIWFMCLFIALPMRLKSQAEDGNVVPGTPASAPSNPMLGKKVLWTTVATFVIWIPLVALILSGWVTIRDIDFFGTMG